MFATNTLLHVVRLAVIVVLIADLLILPRAIVKATKYRLSRYGMLLVLGISALLMQRFIDIVYRWNKPILWYGVPLTFVGAVVLMHYAFMTLTHEEGGE